MKKIKLRIAVRLHIAIVISFVVTYILFIAIPLLFSTFLSHIPFLEGIENKPTLQFIFATSYFLLAVATFFIVFHLLIRKRIRYLNTLSKELEKTPIRMSINGNDEITNLAKNINEMYDRVQKEKSDKEELITHLSHDLRTPLTSIIGYLDILKTKPMDEESAQYLQISYDKAIHLSNLQTALFDYIKISDKDFTANLQTVDVSIFLEQLLTDYILSLDNAGIVTEFVSSAKNQLVVVDTLLLHRVFDNILSNVEKYAKSTLEITVTSDNTHTFVSFENDHSLQNMNTEKIFDRFYTGETSRTNSATGLGLTIAKAAVEKMNGRISAYISEGKFKITVALKNKLPKSS